MGLAGGMLFGSFPTSVPQFILVINWLLEKNFNAKWQRLKNHRLFWVLISFYLLHIVGLIYTENMPRGFDELRTKLPLLVLPLVLFSTRPLSGKTFRWVCGVFFLGVLWSSLYCFLVYAGYTQKEIIDVRKASVFMSHIRFSLCCAFAVIGLVYGTFTGQRTSIKILFVLAAMWLLYFMYTLEMATGFVCLMIVGVVMVMVYAFFYLKKTPLVFILLLIGLFCGYIFNTALSGLHLFDKDPSLSSNKLLNKTMSGRTYLHDTLFPLAENGTLILININDDELHQEWKKRSALPFDGLDKKGNYIRYTILRYLASKGLNKDSAAIASLNPTDIKQIEYGFSNYKYSANDGLKPRWREMVWEYNMYKRGENPSGHTLTMRLEFWKTACYLIRQFPLLGVGTGDVQDAFNIAYQETNSILDPVWRLRCHNQYLAISVAFGIIGFVLFLFYLSYPAWALRKTLHPLFWAFFSIALLSFITEDTLETQAGVSFFGFFYTFFLWMASVRKQEELNHSA